MNFQFFSTPKPKKFTYKPRFYKAENEDNLQSSKSKNSKNSDEFAIRLHESWKQRRKKKEPHSFPLKLVIWVTLIVLVLLYLYRKFFM